MILFRALTEGVETEDSQMKAKEFDTQLKNFVIAASKGRAVFFGVYRGRISEGIDFADSAARVVMAIGIPYSSSKGAFIFRILFLVVKMRFQIRERKLNVNTMMKFARRMQTTSMASAGMIYRPFEP